MATRESGFLGTVKKPFIWFFQHKTYRPLVLRFGDTVRIHPVILFAGLFALSFVFRNIPGINLTNCLGISFVIPYLIWFSGKTKRYLKSLRQTLKISETEYQELVERNGRYRFYRFLLVSALAPLLVFIVNYNAPQGHFQIDGQVTFLGLGLSKWFAIITGMLLLQMNYITITEVFRFNRIEKKYAEVDLLDLHKLDAFSHIGIAAALSMIGLYTVIPLSILNEPELMTSLMSTLVISVPILLVNLLVPLYGVYQDISTQLRKEKRLIRRAIDGDGASLEQLAISGNQTELTTLELLDYRRYINELTPIPIAQHNLARLLGSLLLLVSSWIVPYYYEAIVNAFF